MGSGAARIGTGIYLGCHVFATIVLADLSVVLVHIALSLSPYIYHTYIYIHTYIRIYIEFLIYMVQFCIDYTYCFDLSSYHNLTIFDIVFLL